MDIAVPKTDAIRLREGSRTLAAVINLRINYADYITLRSLQSQYTTAIQAAAANGYCFAVLQIQDATGAGTRFFRVAEG